MLTRIKAHLTPASLLAVVALFVALGGVSYAAVKIDGADIKKASVPGSKLVNGAVSNGKVKRGSLGADRFSAKARTALKGNAGPQGPQGSAGPQGPQGQQGPQGAAGTALAYAIVQDAGPGLVKPRTVGFVDVTTPATGVYCLQPTDAVIAQAFTGGQPTRPTVASVEFGNTGTPTDTLSVLPRGASVACPDDTFEVHTYRNGAAAADVAFSLIVP